MVPADNKRHAMCKNVHHHNGRFPEKSCKHVLNLLKNLKANCEAEKKMLEKDPAELLESFVDRKIKEAILAFRIERTLSKERILELYLNQIYLGGGTYGVAAASLEYFDKPITP